MKLLYKTIFISILLPLLIISSLIIYNLVFKHIKNEIIYAIIIGSYALTFYVARRLKIMTPHYKRPTLKQIARWSLISLFIWGVSLFEINILNPRFHYFEYNQSEFKLTNSIYYLIFTPLLEELFMKSIFMNSLIKLKINSIVIIFLSVSYFAIFHYPSILLIHLLMGLITSYLYYKNKDVVQCILIHSIYNGVLIIEANFFNVSN